MKKKPLRYFFLNGEAHKKIHINRPSDMITAWNYPQHKRVVYTYSDVKRNMQTAFTTQQVCEMVNRNRISIERAILNDMINRPPITYDLESGKPFKYLWREESILELADYFRTVHIGRPRKDGLITPSKMPTERELRAMIRNDTVLYVKTGEDEFRPTWQANF